MVYEQEWRIAQETGYTESKLVTENLVAAISQALRLDSLICRVGHIAGPVSGCGSWAQNDWVSSLVASSASLGKISRTLGPSEVVDWLSVTAVAMSLLDLLFAAKDRACGPRTFVYYHIVKPFKTSWSALLPSFTKYCTSGLEIVAFATRLKALQRSSAEDRNTPTARLKGFFEKSQGPGDGQVAHLETTETLKVSRTMAEPGPVKEDWVKHWMEQWGFYTGNQVDE